MSEPVQPARDESAPIRPADNPSGHSPYVDESHQQPSEGEHDASAQSANYVVARYGMMKQLGRFRHDMESPPRAGTRLVVRTERGVELAEVVCSVGCCQAEETCRLCIEPQRLDRYLADSGPDYPFNRDARALRPANSQDVVEQRHLDGSAREEAVFCRQQIRELGLQMKLVTVEHLLGGERIIFYFSSESRIDFRELVRRLAAQYRTRIEMRQVGARDEARLVADYERCGQHCCCQSFIKNLKPVSMRMAKTQKATLDPSKISGRCGRLMCCLRFEDEGYEDLRKKLPRRNIWVRTAGGVVGRVIDGQILTQLVRLCLIDNTQVVVPNEEIVERDVPAPPMPAPAPERKAREQKVKGPPKLLRDEARQPADVPAPEQAQALPADFDERWAQALEAQVPEESAEESDEEAQEQVPASGSKEQELSQPAQGDGQSKRRRRRGRRRRKGRGGQPPNPNNPQPQ